MCSKGVPQGVYRRVGIGPGLGDGPAENLLNTAGAIPPAVLFLAEPVSRPVSGQVLDQGFCHLASLPRIATLVKSDS